jgi:hypothetical protein
VQKGKYSFWYYFTIAKAIICKKMASVKVIFDFFFVQVAQTSGKNWAN